ncbi:MAG: RIP metalloprotease RseP [Steroidobacteraceae bacterium]
MTSSPLEVLIAILAFIVATGILVAVHEYGHFIVARKLGIRVLRFSIGFGKPLWLRKSPLDGTEYAVSSIPLGGYVKLLDEREAPVPADQVHRAFNRQPVWKRISVLLAGPLFNLAFAILLYWVLFVSGVPALKPVVGEVQPDSIAAHAGMRSDDRIVRVAGKPVGTREAATLGILEDLIDDGAVDLRVMGADGATRDLRLEAYERRRELTQAENLLPGLGFEFWFPRLPAIIGNVLAGSPAEQAGLKVGDEIIALDGKSVGDFNQLVKLVEPRANREVSVQLKRNGTTLERTLRIRGEDHNGREVGRIGVAPNTEGTQRMSQEMVTLEQFGPLAAFGQAAHKTWDTSVFTLRILGRIVTGDVSFKNISGPITIAEYTGFAARQGWQIFLSTLALISISLGVFNLLPIPILDGGQIVYQLAELVKGRPVSERAQLLGQQIGIAVLLMVMSLAFYNDIAKHLN